MSDEIPIGTVLAGKYRVVGQLGEGGMGVVVAAEHVALGQRFAIKVLPADAEPTMSERFLREGRAAARIQSEHVVQVFDVGEDQGRPYLVMELLEGRDLDAMVVEDGPLSVELTVDYVLQACEALAEAHAMGIVHRDIKPANLFCSRTKNGGERIKLLDFGISKEALTAATPVEALTNTGTVLGSPHYIAPEQLASSRDVDSRADVWSLGAAIYELLTGLAAFSGESLGDVFAAIMEEEPLPPSTMRLDLPKALDEVVLRCLRKDPAERYQTVGELAVALAAFAPATARPSVERIRKSLGEAAPAARAEPKGSEPVDALAMTVMPDTDEVPSDLAVTTHFEREPSGPAQASGPPPAYPSEPPHDSGVGKTLPMDGLHPVMGLAATEVSADAPPAPPPATRTLAPEAHSPARRARMVVWVAALLVFLAAAFGLVLWQLS